MTKSNSEFRIPGAAFLWIAAILFVYFFGLTIPLVGPDEPRYSQVAREMFERGDWITPTLGGFNWFEKPALLYWLQIVSYNLFGVSEFAARFGSALFGIGTVASLWLLGRHVETSDGDASDRGFANCLAIVSASTVGIIAFAHGASFDIVLTFPMTAAMVAYYIYDSGVRDNSSRMLPLAAFYFFIGLALLAKGLVGIVFPFAIVGFYHVLLRRWPGRTFLISLVWGTMIAVAVAALWYVPMYLRNGYQFIDEFFIQHHFQRYTSNKYLHPQPFHFFFWVLPLMTIPWLPFFVAALVSFGKRAVGRIRGAADKSGRAYEFPLQVYALAWIAVPLVFFSFSGSKLPGYILPALPAAIILTALYVFRFLQKSAMRRYLIHSIAAGTFFVISGAMIFVVPRFAETDTVQGLFAAASARGLDNAPVLMLHGLSHNAEFYAPGRIIRDAEGKQKKVFGPPEVRREIRQRGGEQILVLVPLEYLYQLTQSDFLNAEVLKDNGEHALVVVTERN